MTALQFFMFLTTVFSGIMFARDLGSHCGMIGFPVGFIVGGLAAVIAWKLFLLFIDTIVG